MITNREKGFLLVLVCFALISCTTYKATYRYGNLTYEQPEPALAAQKADIDAIVSNIPPTDHPVGGSAIVIIPSIPNAMKTLVVWTGPEPSQEQKEKAIRFHATALVNEFRGRGEEI